MPAGSTVNEMVRPIHRLAPALAVLLVAAAVAAAEPTPDTLHLSLADAIRTAVGQSPVRTQATATRVSGATTLARGVNGLLPSVSGSVGYGWEREGSDPAVQGWNAGLSVNQVVFSPSAFAGLVSSAVRLSYSSTSAREQEARLIYDATVDYLNLLKYSRLVDVADVALDRADEYLVLTEARQQRGLASSIDLLRARAQQAQARLGLLEARQNLATGAETFKATAGLGRNTVVVPTEELAAPADFAVTDPDSLVAEIERHNPGVRMAARSRSVAHVNQVASIGSVLPDVSLHWQRSSQASSLPSCLSEWRDGGTSSYGLRASLPLVDLKTYVLNVVDASNDARRADAAARLADLQIRATAVSAVGAYQGARERYDLAQATLELNQRLHDLAREQLRLGSVSQLDFLAVEADLVSAQAAQIGAVSDTYVRAANISYLLGKVETGQ